MILVVGATGSLGGSIATKLLSQGKSVRVLARHDSPSEELAKAGMATSLETLRQAGAEVVYGDLKDPASLLSACQGVDTVITTANSIKRGGPDNIETVDLNGNLNLVAAAKQAGVKHFIFTSLLGASSDNPSPFSSAKGKVERALRESGMDFTIIAPNALMDVWTMLVVGVPALKGESVTLVEPATHRHTFIAAADVAAFAAAAVDNPAARNAYLPLGGPQALSWKEVVETFERMLARPIDLVLVKPGEVIPGQMDFVSQMLPTFEAFESLLDMTELSQVYGITLTPLETFIQRALSGGRP